MKDIINPVDTDDGLFHDGDPTTETEGTIVYARIMNDIQGATIDIQTEMQNVLADAGIKPDPAKENQLSTAIQKIISEGITDGVKGLTKTVNNKGPDEQGNIELTADDVDALSKNGTATAAEKLATARKIAGHDFDGTADISISATDTGAMPYYGNALSVDLNTLGAYSAAGIYYQPGNAGATTANHYPVAEAGTLEITPGAYGCQHEYTTFGTGRKFVRGLSAAWNGKDGPWSAWKEYFQSTGGAVSGTINQDGVAQATYTYTALSTAAVGVKNYLRKMRGGNGDTIWHETVQAGEYRIATGNTDAQDEFVLSSAGRATFRGEVVSKSANGFRIAYGTYGVFLRSDGSNTYLLLTASGDLLGNYNSLRPFSVNNATGDVTIGKLILSNYASFDARYLTASSTLTRLGAQVVVNVPNNATVSAPAGCVSSAIKCGNSGSLTGLGYRPLQILVNGTWVNVQSL